MDLKNKLFISLNVLIVFIGFNYSIYSNEQLLEDEEIVYFELAPVDPRSLMQGDYMRLNYSNSRINNDIIPQRGFVVFKKDTNNVALKVRTQQNKEPLSEGEYLISYTKRNSRNLNFGAESYFFQEGTGDQYEVAKYGGLKINKEGKSLLIGLYDVNFKKLGEN